MADLTITAANVSVGATTTTQAVRAGVAITPGQPVYLDTADSKYKLADSDALATAKCAGVSISNAAADGDYFYMATLGDMDLGTTLAVGEVYVVSTNSGMIAPVADLTTGDYVTILGVATATDTLDLKLHVSDAVKP